jgi:hypothetical protein
MPNLFGNLIVVNTHFALTDLSTRSRLLRRNGVIGPRKSARLKIIEPRSNDFAQFLKSGGIPTRFSIDNKLDYELPYEEIVSYNTNTSIMRMVQGCDPMDIKQMRLTKTESMMAIDRKLTLQLRQAIGHWNTEFANKRRSVGQTEAHRSRIIKHKKLFSDVITRLGVDLAMNDNDSPFPLGTISTESHPGTVSLFLE